MLRATQGSVQGQGAVRRTERLPRHVRVLLRLSKRGLPEPVCSVAVQHGIEVPAGDGVLLLTDHYRPLAEGPCPTLLVRTPYGRGFPWDYIYGALFACQGFHVVIQSCRGTGGSGGRLEPFVNEAADGQAALAWLRRQDWFTGALGTIGASYLGYVQWALATDAPPELRAMVVQVSSDDFHSFLYPGGAFALESTLVGVAGLLFMERGFARFALAITRLLRRIWRAERTLPLVDGFQAVFGRRVDFLEQWLAHAEPGDPYWAIRRAVADAGHIPPTSLLTGWSDVCLDQTLAIYRKLRDAGRAVRLIVGPWSHTSGFSDDMPALLDEALRWLRAHLNGDARDPSGVSLSSEPVRVHIGQIGAAGEWRDLPDWPPPDMRVQQWHLHGDGTLATELPATAEVLSWRYDPAAPTPAVGGPRLDTRNFGPRRNDKLEARADVLVFTSAPLAEPVEVIGPVGIKVRVRGSNPHFDMFARLCDVDPRGRSWNVCDGLVRLGDVSSIEDPSPGHPGRPWLDVTVPMSATAHRFSVGHRLRVQVSGGAHPRFARNTGTGEPIATATRLVPVDIQISHDPAQPCLLSLPVHVDRFRAS